MTLKELLTKTINKIKSVDAKHTPVLLWWNSSPYAALSAQTLTISELANYDYLSIAYATGFQQVVVNNLSPYTSMCQLNAQYDLDDTSYPSTLSQRRVDVNRSTNKVTIGDCKVRSIDMKNTRIDNTYGIIYAIYGFTQYT